MGCGLWRSRMLLLAYPPPSPFRLRQAYGGQVGYFPLTPSSRGETLGLSYNKRMRLARFAIVILAVPILFVIFAYTSSLNDDLPMFGPYVSSETVHFYREPIYSYDGKTLIASVRCYQERSMNIDDQITLREAKALVKRSRHPLHGLFCEAEDDAIIPPSAMSPFTSEDFAVRTLTHQRELTWNQILLIRLTHLGHDPFERSPNRLLNVANTLAP